MVLHSSTESVSTYYIGNVCCLKTEPDRMKSEINYSRINNGWGISIYRANKTLVAGKQRVLYFEVGLLCISFLPAKHGGCVQNTEYLWGVYPSLRNQSKMSELNILKWNGTKG